MLGNGRNIEYQQKRTNCKCCCKIVQTKGFVATSMRDLAAELGIEAASIYYHFKSKEELLEKICFDMADKFITNAREVNDIYFNAEEKLRMAIKFHIETITENQNQSSVFLSEWRNLSELKLKLFRQLRQQYENQFTIILADGEKEDIFDDVDKKFAVLSILSTINFINEWYKPEGKMNASEIADKLSHFIMGGLRKRLVTDR